MRRLMPFVIGALMGAMMLVMFHDQIVAGQFGMAALFFIAAHLLVIAAVGALVWALMRLTKLDLSTWRHRPSIGHVSKMFGAAGLTVAIIHLVHGGPA